jgi:glycerol-3-phosphate dehydrogenase (NAD(P)+)
MNKIGIMGSGAFGTGLAATFAKATNDVTLWGRNSECIKEINSKNTNSRYLPGIELPKNIFATSNFKDLKNLDVLLMVTPAQCLRKTLKNFDIKSLNCPLVVCSKGIEKNTGKLQSEIIKDVIENTQCAALSGPGFAVELAKGMPTALTLAAEDKKLGVSLQSMISTESLRVYLSNDLHGVQLGGALKNVFAIASGIVVGSNLGESARAAIITRGFTELSRLAYSMGGSLDTLNGLSGFGDLTLSCTSQLSRNFSYGQQLAQSGNLKPGQTVEGIDTALITLKLAEKHKIEMPIASQVALVLSGKTTVDIALSELMRRPLKDENIS